MYESLETGKTSVIDMYSSVSTYHQTRALCIYNVYCIDY